MSKEAAQSLVMEAGRSLVNGCGAGTLFGLGGAIYVDNSSLGWRCQQPLFDTLSYQSYTPLRQCTLDIMGFTVHTPAQAGMLIGGIAAVITLVVCGAYLLYKHTSADA